MYPRARTLHLIGVLGVEWGSRRGVDQAPSAPHSARRKYTARGRTSSPGDPAPYPRRKSSGAQKKKFLKTLRACSTAYQLARASIEEALPLVLGGDPASPPVLSPPRGNARTADTLSAFCDRCPIDMNTPESTQAATCTGAARRAARPEPMELSSIAILGRPSLAHIRR